MSQFFGLKYPKVGRLIIADQKIIICAQIVGREGVLGGALP